jgi:tetratricopeptide (TPR) repeat protein
LEVGCFSLVILLSLNLGLVAGESNSVASTNAQTTNAPAVKPPPPLVTPRDYFNAGTHKLQEKKWQEAEMCLQTALAKQNQAIQPAALYNLGQVRFGQGVEELKKSLEAGTTAAGGRAAVQQANSAIEQANEALISSEIPKMVDAYMRGRGTRKDLKAAAFAVKRALEMHGVVLRRWERSLGDFKSALELNPSDTNAQHNVEVVERAIAKLVDMMQQLQQAANAMGKPEKELGEKLKQLRGQIPEPNMPPGAAGDEEEEEDGKPREPKESDREGPNKEGREIFLTPEEAGWLLERFKLGGDKRLPMGQGDQAPPKDRKGRNW